jgi:signal transduction histidine kinase/CheY-like chemotaxis protein
MEAVGKTPRILQSGKVPPEIYRSLWETIARGQEWHGELQCKKKNGEFYWIAASISAITDCSGRISHYLAIQEDISERKRRDEHLIRSQRLASIGELASGIAHDLNNVLAPILMSAEMLHESMPPSLQDQIVETIEMAAERGANIIRQLLTFARGAEGERAVLDPREVVKQVAHIIRQTFPKSISLQLHGETALWPVLGNPTQLHQVILNLCLNARDAMPSGGELRISAHNCEYQENTVLPDIEAKPGRYVKLQVADTGMGIPVEYVDKVFDPFFTTKEPGKGTGLGLSTALGIIRSHHGFVTVHSEQERGATFQVFIPATSEAPNREIPRGHSENVKGRGEWILVVDDEPSIRKMTETIAMRNGYSVLTAENGIDALEVYAAHADRIKLVVTDLMMPQMDGARLARALKEIRPQLPIIVASGYCDASTEADMRALGVRARLAKPFKQDQLLRAIHDALKSEPKPQIVPRRAEGAVPCAG